MMSAMALTAHPNNKTRLGVVRMMRLDFWFSTGAWFLDQLASAYEHLRIRAAGTFQPLVVAQLAILPAGCTNVGVVARSAVSLPWTIRSASAFGTRFHTNQFTA